MLHLKKILGKEVGDNIARILTPNKFYFYALKHCLV